MMNNNLTTKFMEGLQAAQKAAQSAGRAQIYPAELLLALMEQEGGVLSAVLTRAGGGVQKPVLSVFRWGFIAQL